MYIAIYVHLNKKTVALVCDVGPTENTTLKPLEKFRMTVVDFVKKVRTKTSFAI